MVTAILVRVIAAIVGRTVADEFRAWTPWVVRKVIRLATLHLQRGYQARFREEWQSHVDEVPGEIGKLVLAFGYLIAAPRMQPWTRRQQTPWVVDHLLLSRMKEFILLIVVAIAFTGRITTDTLNRTSIYQQLTSRLEMQQFRSVPNPKAGDLVVWRGHVGIVVDPETLRTGTETSSHDLSNWKRHPQFFRYTH